MEKRRQEIQISTISGIQRIFDPRGNVFVEARFENGIMHGSYTEFFDEERKKISIEGRYEDGMKQGVWSSYNRRGKIEGVEIFNKGELLERTLYDGEE